jgi:hypothetical protein
MTPNAAMMFAMPTLIFACGAALLSYRFYAAYHAWALGEFGYKSHLPGILGTALMLFAILFAATLGWTHVIVTLLGGFAVAYLYVYVFRMRTEAALLGPVFAVLSILLIPTSYWA